MPVFVHASVVISEVAWMGSLEDANEEWIELYNNGESQSVSGWTLTAVDGQPNITLEGSIGSNAYAVLERTDDDTVSGITALKIYTGALSNTSEKLELRDQNGALIDSVDSGDGWERVGGNNTTKETAQRSGEPSVGAWITAPASPGRGNSGVGTSQNEQTQTITHNKNILYGLPDEDENRPHIEPGLILDIGEEQTVSVGVPTAFQARTFRERGEEIVVSDIEWNFGDGTTGKGRNATHTYRYEGSYIVSATGRRTGFLREIIDTAQLVVHVVPSPIEIAHADTTCIELKNTSSGVIEVSGYVLLSGTSHFTIPKNTLLLPNTGVRFPRATTKIAGTHVWLFRPDGSLATEYGAPIVPVPQAQIQKPSSLHAVRTVEPATLKKEITSILDGITFPDGVPEFTETAQADTGSVEPEGGDGATRTWWWILGLCITIATAGFAVVLLRHEQQEVIEGFMIESEKE